MIAMQRFMPDVLAALLRKAPLSDEKIAFAWRTSVGPAVAHVTTIELRGRVLHVRTRDATWQREIERSMGIVRSRMEALLGPGVLGDIQVTAD
jgi:hypothetical protein